MFKRDTVLIWYEENPQALLRVNLPKYVVFKCYQWKCSIGTLNTSYNDLTSIEQ